MPHHPSEEVAGDNLTDKVAQHSKDSTASDHPIHDENKGPVEQAKPEHHQSKGPQISENMPPTASKDELAKRAEHLNK